MLWNANLTQFLWPQLTAREFPAGERVEVGVKLIKSA
jgi:hypothetical protein